MKMTSPTILTPQQWTMFDRMKSAMTFGGRKRATTGGSLISDMVSLHKSILLCGDCQGKFDYRRHGYYSVWRYEHQSVIGPCDVCRVQIVNSDGRLFLHEEERPKAWVSPDDHRRQRATQRRIAETHCK